METQTAMMMTGTPIAMPRTRLDEADAPSPAEERKKRQQHLNKTNLKETDMN